MQEKIIGFKNTVYGKWSSFDKSLKAKIISISVMLLLALLFTVYFTSRPTWVIIQSNSDISSLGKMQNAFEESSIPNQIVKNGTAIQVHQKDVDKAKILLAEKNITKSGFTFEDALSANSIGMSENDKKEIYLRAFETEIAKHIITIDGIESANVKLVLASDSVLFNSQKTTASASVAVVTSKELTRDQTLTIARLVAMSVEGLEMENIEIIDQNANSLYSGSSADTSSYSSKSDVEGQKVKDVEFKIRAALSKLYDDINIITNLKFDWNKKQEKSLTYVPPVDDSNVGVPRSQTITNENVINGAEGTATPGIDSNDQNAPNYAMDSGNGGTYDAAKEQNEYLYNQNEIIIDAAGGDVVYDKSSISVVVYKFKNYNEALLHQSGVLSKDYTWNEFKEENSVQNKMEIDPDLIESLRVGTGIQNLNVVGYEKPIFVDTVKQPLKVEQIVILAVLAILIALLAIGLIKKVQPDDVEEIEPELAIEDLIVSNKLKEEEIVDLDNISEGQSEFKSKIDDFVHENSEIVANLLRNWLNEDWGD